jgi:hypothetical protein
MNEDPKYWEETVLPKIKELKLKQEEARQLLLKMEAIAYDKAGYMKVKQGAVEVYVPKVLTRVGIINAKDLGNNWTARHHLLKLREKGGDK